MSAKDGIEGCFTCGSSLKEGQIGYCDPCMKETEYAQDPTLAANYTQFELRKYAEHRRQEILEFLNNEKFKITHIDAEKVTAAIQEGKQIWAVLSPVFAASLDYALIRKVRYIHPVSAVRKKWLTEYWLNKYEIDIEDFENEVGLIFNYYSDWYDTWNESTYDYPASLIQTYCLRENKA